MDDFNINYAQLSSLSGSYNYINKKSKDTTINKDIIIKKDNIKVPMNHMNHDFNYHYKQLEELGKKK